MRNALDDIVSDVEYLVSEMVKNVPLDPKYRSWYAAVSAQYLSLANKLRKAIAEERKSRPNLVAEWKLGPEYESAYCSHCGHMQYADWDAYIEAAEKIGTFHEEYKFCPNCGAQMKGGTDGSK